MEELERTYAKLANRLTAAIDVLVNAHTALEDKLKGAAAGEESEQAVRRIVILGRRMRASIPDRGVGNAAGILDLLDLTDSDMRQTLALRQRIAFDPPRWERLGLTQDVESARKAAEDLLELRKSTHRTLRELGQAQTGPVKRDAPGKVFEGRLTDWLASPDAGIPSDDVKRAIHATTQALLKGKALAPGNVDIQQLARAWEGAVEMGVRQIVHDRRFGTQEGLVTLIEFHAVLDTLYGGLGRPIS